MRADWRVPIATGGCGCCKEMSFSFEEYLASAKSILSAMGEEDAVSVSVGNESCDLDSIVCAISHAHFLAQQGQKPPSLPLLQCPRADFALRTDAVWLFSHLQLDTAQLLFLEEVMGPLQAVRRVSATLVDHATPTGLLLEVPSLEVVGVIDHHLPSPTFPGKPGQFVVEPVGSCATLVAEMLLGDQSYSMPTPVATLLLGAILLDTVGLDESAGRVTDKDKAIAERLGLLVDLSSTELYRSLSAARLSTSGLTAHQLLRKDLKCAAAGAHSLGFSSVTCQLSAELLGRADTEEAVHTLCQSRGLSALLVLGVNVTEASVTREIAIFCPDSSDVADAVASLLESDGQLECRAAPQTSCILLRQGNPSLSRKYILPLVVRFLTSVSHEEDREKEPEATETRRIAQASQGQEGEPEEIPEYTLEEETRDVRSHRLVTVAEEDRSVIDMAVVQPYKKIVQHGGYVGPDRQAVLVISACYLPPRSLPHYNSTVDNLYLYVVSVIQRLVVDDYLIVYLHSGAPQHSMPSISILRKFYHMLDHRLRKQLKHLYIVHPTFWVRSMLRLARPFISTKFYRKVHLVRCLQQLPVPVDHSLIPAPVARADSASQPRPSRPSQRYHTTDHSP